MEQQPATQAVAAPAASPQSATSQPQPLDWRQQMVVDYFATGGIIWSEDNSFKKMTVTELAAQCQVDRVTIYRWRDNIPGFWDRVAQARKSVSGQSRIMQVWNGVYLRAAKGDAQQADMFLRNFDDNYRQANDKSDRNSAETLIDLMNAARALQHENNQASQAQQPLTAAPMPIIEGETA